MMEIVSTSPLGPLGPPDSTLEQQKAGLKRILLEQFSYSPVATLVSSIRSSVQGKILQIPEVAEEDELMEQQGTFHNTAREQTRAKRHMQRAAPNTPHLLEEFDQQQVISYQEMMKRFDPDPNFRGRRLTNPTAAICFLNSLWNCMNTFQHVRLAARNLDLENGTQFQSMLKPLANGSFEVDNLEFLRQRLEHSADGRDFAIDQQADPADAFTEMLSCKSGFEAFDQLQEQAKVEFQMEVRCPTCHSIDTNYEPLNESTSLLVNFIPGTDNNIQALLDAQFPSGSIDQFCQKCQTDKTFVQTRKILKTNKMLTLVMDRSLTHYDKLVRPNEEITFNGEVFQLKGLIVHQNFLTSSAQSNDQSSLLRRFQGGHYLSYIALGNGRFNRMNDTALPIVTTAPLDSRMLFYEKVDGRRTSTGASSARAASGAETPRTTAALASSTTPSSSTVPTSSRVGTATAAKTFQAMDEANLEEELLTSDYFMRLPEEYFEEYFKFHSKRRASKGRTEAEIDATEEESKMPGEKKKRGRKSKVVTNEQILQEIETLKQFRRLGIQNLNAHKSNNIDLCPGNPMIKAGFKFNQTMKEQFVLPENPCEICSESYHGMVIGKVTKKCLRCAAEARKKNLHVLTFSKENLLDPGLQPPIFKSLTIVEQCVIKLACPMLSIYSRKGLLGVR